MEPTQEKQFLRHLELHKGILHKVARLYMDTAEDREDLHQEIIIQLWKSFGHFKGESQFSTWMYRVAVNTAITFLKKEKKRLQAFGEGDHPELADEKYSPEKDQQLEIFYQAVQELNPIEKALIFYFMEDLSHKETGQHLGITEGNVRVKLNRAKEKLHKIINKQAYEF